MVTVMIKMISDVVRVEATVVVVRMIAKRMNRRNERDYSTETSENSHWEATYGGEANQHTIDCLGLCEVISYKFTQRKQQK